MEPHRRTAKWGPFANRFNREKVENIVRTVRCVQIRTGRTIICGHYSVNNSAKSITSSSFFFPLILSSSSSSPSMSAKNRSRAFLLPLSLSFAWSSNTVVPGINRFATRSFAMSS